MVVFEKYLSQFDKQNHGMCHFYDSSGSYYYSTPFQYLIGEAIANDSLKTNVRGNGNNNSEQIINQD